LVGRLAIFRKARLSPNMDKGKESEQMNRTMMLVGAAALLALVMIAVVLQVMAGFGSSPQPEVVATSATQGLSKGGYWSIVALLAAAAIGSTFLPKGSGVGLGISIACLIAFLIFGPKTGKVAEKIQETASGAILDDKPISQNSPVSQPQAPVAQLPVAPQQQAYPAPVTRQVVLASDSEWAEPVGLAGGRCYKAWTEKFGKPTELVQDTSIERPSEQDWRDVKPGGYSTTKARWVRVKSAGPGPTEIIVELRPDGTCK
jgi:hypothetical protein